MMRPRAGSKGRRLVLWAGLSVGGLVAGVGCQVEMAGMTLPSGKYMYDDVQYFPPGPDFPWANTQAATQRARIAAAGYDTSSNPALSAPLPGMPGSAPVGTPPPAAGALDPTQNVPGQPTNVNVQQLPPAAMPAPPAGVPAPDGGAAAPPADGAMPEPK